MIARLAASVGAVWLALAGLAQADCAVGTIALRDGDTMVEFSVELAQTPEERAVGLMFRESMPRFHSMLFVFERPQTVGFWMMNTLIPLDMLFMDRTGTVQRIHAMAVPLSTETIPGGDDIQYVLEINGGLARELGLGVGTQARHPAIPPDLAAWPCPGPQG